MIEEVSPASNSIESECSKSHCFYAFDTLYCALTSARPISPNFFRDDKYPLFVTWQTRTPSRRSTRLRGCIGSFEPLLLTKGIPEYALISAFKDHRFRRIEERELESLECVISLLTDFEDADSYLDWEVGTHGIQITFGHPSLLPATDSSAPSPLSSSASLPTTRISSRQKFSACYLPDVIPEQGWDQVQAVDSAIEKAGWNGQITEDLRRSVKLRRYQSSVCTVGWDEYLKWREANAR